MERIQPASEKITPEAFETFCRENRIGLAEHGGTSFASYDEANAALTLLTEAGFSVRLEQDVHDVHAGMNLQRIVLAE